MVTRLVALLCWLSLVGVAYGQVPDTPPKTPPEEQKCIVDAKVLITKFGLAVADNNEDDLQTFTGDKASAILKIINDDPPPTHFKADTLFAILHHGAEGEEEKGAVLVFLISDECVTGVLPKVPMGAWAHIISRAIGDDT